jgi:4-hydroxybenzoate polyprenyltransferase
MAFALGLAGLAAEWSGHPLVLAEVALIIGLQLLYNLEPVRLKRRGLVGVTAFCLAVGVLPFLVSYHSVRPGLDAPIGAILAGQGLLAVGRMTLWSVPDRAADAGTGMRTPPVRYGAGPTLVLSCALMVAGLAATGWGVWWDFGAGWAIPAVAPHAVFLGGAVRSAGYGDSGRMRRRDMPLVTIGELILAAIPLLAR